VRRAPALAVLAILASSSVSYFKYQRPVQVSAGAQNYMVIDETLWQHARPDLSDLRLYSADKEVPYFLTIEHENSQHERTPLPVLQQSLVDGKTQFLIDMSALAAYDQVDLDIATKNYVAHARVEGQDDPHGPQWAQLSQNTIYDLTNEKLGSNHVLRFPRSTFKYLRVTIDGAVKPDDIHGAASEVRDEHPAHWLTLNGSPKQSQEVKDSAFLFTISTGVPAEQVTFVVDPAQPNFYRRVEVQDGNGSVLGAGDIDRIHMVRDGKKIDSEDYSIALNSYGRMTGPGVIKVIVRNGDDPPLRINEIHLEQRERRVYFQAPSESPLTLYYGDEKLGAPVYEYAKLFQSDPAAAQATLGPETPNNAYTDRPDERPWSERHPAVLWAAIIAAVVILGAIALRSLRGQQSNA
jgi:hypothetical protein